MEKFWAVILIFVIVAAGGLLYVNQVYNPQKETQMAMADTANQTLSVVKQEMGSDTTSSIVDADSVKFTVNKYCNMEANTVEIIVKTDKETRTYLNESDGIDTQLNGITGRFAKTPQTDSAGELIRIRFEELDE